MNDIEKLGAATSILTKLAGGYSRFERWPEGDGFLRMDGDTDLTPAEVEFLSTVRKPDAGGGPEGLPDDFADDEGLM